MTQYELETRWITAEGIPGVSNRYGDLVEIKSGEYSGRRAEVIALISLDPEPVHVVVLPPDEKSVVLPQSELKRTGLNSGRTLQIMPPGRTPFIKKRT